MTEQQTAEEQPKTTFSVSNEQLLEPKIEAQICERFNLNEETSTNTSVLTILSKVMNSAERFEEMLVVMKMLTKVCNGVLTLDLMNSLAACYKNLLNSRRGALKAIYQRSTPGELLILFGAYLKRVIINFCRDATVTGKYILERTPKDNCELRLMANKMLADYYRYWSESIITVDMTPEQIHELEIVKTAEEFYEESYKCSLELNPLHYLRLGVALNRSVFYFEILKQVGTAIEMAQKAFNEAQDQHASMQDEDIRHTPQSNDALSLLHENIKIWLSPYDDQIQPAKFDDENEIDSDDADEDDEGDAEAGDQAAKSQTETAAAVVEPQE